MARLALDTKSTSIFTASKDWEATPIMVFENGKATETQVIDNATNLPLWQVVAELIEGEESTLSQKIKVASVNKPELKARTEYFVDGTMFATPYLDENGKRARVAISYLVQGGFKTSRSAGLPDLKNG